LNLEGASLNALKPNYMNLRATTVLIAASLLGGSLGITPVTSAPSAHPVIQEVNGRSLIVYAPTQLPAFGARPLVIVLHGGLGSAQRIETTPSEHALSMDAVAETDGFIVAYLNGTPVTRFLGSDKLGWNAGSCCGQPAAKNIDDVGYITGAIDYLVNKYGIDRQKIYGIGHSNGSMLAQRIICNTDLFRAAVTISGTLGTDNDVCPDAHGKRILAIHGSADENVPVAGGRGTKGLSKTIFRSEKATHEIFVNAGATYDLQIVSGADHNLAHIDAALETSEGQSVAQKAARFFGLTR
jgi:polyhydroxybutyrate depolymerase